MQRFHYWPAVFLVEVEALFGGRALRPLLQHVGQILSGMLASGEIQPDPTSFADGYDSAGEHSRAFRCKVYIAGRIPVEG
jgi:hypothetical protein